MLDEQLISISEHSIGRAGRDLFLSDKDITIVMVPYERYSIFPKAVDDLYRVMDVPFNLILIEGNAPEDVRVALERRQRQHGNMTIIYTNHIPTLANAFNLATPHIKTQYALLLDNEIRLPHGTLKNLIKKAKETKAEVIASEYSMMPRSIRMRNGEGRDMAKTIQTFGFRACFLISRKAIHEMGKLFDENSSPYSFGVDFFYRINSKGLRMVEDSEIRYEMRVDQLPRSSDLPLFKVQWNRERFFKSLEQLHSVWGIQLESDPVYESWLQAKMSLMDKPTTLEKVNLAFIQFREVGWKRFQDTLMTAPLSWSKKFLHL